MLIASVDRSEILKLKEQLSNAFETKDLGKAKKILGMELNRSEEGNVLKVSQKLRVLEKFGMKGAKSILTPTSQQLKLSVQMCLSTNEETAYMDKVSYASAVGSIMYSMICTRPDLVYASSLVNRFMANPRKGHWEAVKWVLRYLKGTVSYGLLYKRGKPNSGCLVGYCDLDFSGDLDKRRSLTGYCFTLYGNVVSWKAVLQLVVALSTTEAEFMALTEATKEAIWLKGLVEEFGIEQSAVPIYRDS